MNFKSHQAASTQLNIVVTETSKGWDVKSFEVTETTITCPFEECSEKCYQCGACWHIFSCSCEAAETANNRSYSCKHVHLVVMVLTGIKTNTTLTTNPPVPIQAAAQQISFKSTAVSGFGSIILPGRDNTPLKKQARQGKPKQQFTRTKKKRECSKPSLLKPVEIVEQLNRA